MRVRRKHDGVIDAVEVPRACQRLLLLSILSLLVAVVVVCRSRVTQVFAVEHKVVLVERGSFLDAYTCDCLLNLLEVLI